MFYLMLIIKISSKISLHLRILVAAIILGLIYFSNHLNIEFYYRFKRSFFFRLRYLRTFFTLIIYF